MTILDLSMYQGSLSVAAFQAIKASGISRVILKAGGSNARTYTDRVYVQNARNARAAGLPLGHYWFNGYGTPVADAQYFAAHLSAYQAGDWLILDIESYSATTGMWTPADVLAFAHEIRALMGVTIVAYMSASVTRAANWAQVVAYGVALWVAAYQASAPTVAYWATWIAWQYTSSGRVPGIAGNVDLSHPGTAPTATPTPTPKGFRMRIIRNNTQGDPGYGGVFVVTVETGQVHPVESPAYAELWSARNGVQVEDLPAAEVAYWLDQCAATRNAIAAAVWATVLTGANGAHAAADRLVGADLKAGTAPAATVTLPPTLAADIATASAPHIQTAVANGLHTIGAAFSSAA